MNDERNIRLDHPRHAAGWDELPLTEQPASIKRAWPWWLVVLCLALILVPIAAGVVELVRGGA